MAGVGLCSVLSACVSLRAASAGQIGCKSGDIEISDEDEGWSSHTWTATCRGRSYSCSLVSTGIESGQVSCSPMSAMSRRDPTAPKEAPIVLGTLSSPLAGHPPARSGLGSTERAYDEERGLHIVRGTFHLRAGLRLHLIAIPQLTHGTIAVILRGRSKDATLQQCGTLEVLVNEQPFPPAETSRRTEGANLNIEGRFPFELFEPLAQQYSTFGARACGEKLKLREAQLQELKKFFVIRTQIAQQVQGRQLERESTPETPSEPAPAATDP